MKKINLLLLGTILTSVGYSQTASNLRFGANALKQGAHSVFRQSGQPFTGIRGFSSLKNATPTFGKPVASLNPPSLNKLNPQNISRFYSQPTNQRSNLTYQRAKSDYAKKIESSLFRQGMNNKQGLKNQFNKNQAAIIAAGLGLIGAGAASSALHPGSVLAETTDKKYSLDKVLQIYTPENPKDLDTLQFLAGTPKEILENRLNALDKFLNSGDPTDLAAFKNLATDYVNSLRKQHIPSIVEYLTPQPVNDFYNILGETLTPSKVLNHQAEASMRHKNLSDMIDLMAKKLAEISPEKRDEFINKRLNPALSSIRKEMDDVDYTWFAMHQLTKSDKEKEDLENIAKILFPERYSWSGWFYNKLGY